MRVVLRTILHYLERILNIFLIQQIIRLHILRLLNNQQHGHILLYLATDVMHLLNLICRINIHACRVRESFVFFV